MYTEEIFDDINVMYVNFEIKVNYKYVRNRPLLPFPNIGPYSLYMFSL